MAKNLEFAPAGFEYVLFDYNKKTKEVTPVKTLKTKSKRITLDFELTKEGKVILLNDNKVLAMVGSGTLTGIMLPINEAKSETK